MYMIFFLQGDDMVSECVISPTADEFALEPEVFISYNIGKSNDRIYLNAVCLLKNTFFSLLISSVIIKDRTSSPYSQHPR